MFVGHVWIILCCIVSSLTTSPRPTTPSKWCHREPLVVNLTELGWEARVIEPVRLDIGQCVGRCGKVDRTYHSTLHAEALAVWKRLLKEENLKWKSVAGPCCVSRQLEAVSVTMRTLGGVRRTKVIEDLVAVSCQCS